MTSTRCTSILTAALLAAAVAGCAGPASPGEDTPDAAATTGTSTGQAPISPRITLAPAPSPTATADGFPIGTAVAVDYSWTVTVTAVSLDAAAAVTAVAPDASAPSGRFVLVDLSATQTEGGVVGQAPPFDLQVQLEDPSGTTYGQCDGASELLTQGLLTPGPDGAISWQVCLDVLPAAAAPTSVVVVSDVLATTAGGSPVRWSLD